MAIDIPFAAEFLVNVDGNQVRCSDVKPDAIVDIAGQATRDVTLVDAGLGHSLPDNPTRHLDAAMGA